jgi:hypothetical protein
LPITALLAWGYCDVWSKGIGGMLVRHPLEVIDSLRQHAELVPTASCLLWLRHILDAEHASRDFPRAIVTYDALLSDWSGVISCLQTGIGVRWPRRSAYVDLEIEQFLKVPVRRGSADSTELPLEAQAWLIDTYNALKQLSSNPIHRESLVRLDMIRSELNRAFAIFGPLLVDLAVDLSKYRNHMRDTADRIQRLYDGLKDSDLFDMHWYLHRYPDIAKSRVDPLLHYLHHGTSEARDPNPFFDTDWYLEQNPDVKASGLDPLAHYLHHGAAEGRDPSPLFDTDWYQQQYPDVADANPLAHYLKRGRLQGLRPKPTNE